MAARSEHGKAPEADATGDKAAPGATPEVAAGAAAANPATRKLVTDLALRGGALLARKIIDRRLSGMDYTPQQASQILAGRGLTKAAASAVISRLGFKSLPKSLLIGGVVLAKTLYDRKRVKAAKDASGK